MLTAFSAHSWQDKQELQKIEHVTEILSISDLALSLQYLQA